MFWYRILISAHSYVVAAPRGYFGCQNVFVNSQQSPLNHGSLHWPLPLEAACSCLDLPSYMVLGTVSCLLAEPPLISDIFPRRFEAYSFSRTTSFLTLLFWLSRSHPLFRHRYQIHNWHTPGLNHTSRCPTIIRDSLFPRGHDYFEARGSNGHERRREPITNLIM